MGCSSSLPALRTVKQVDVRRFVGKWKVVGVIPTYFEKGAVNPTESYTWDEKKKQIAVDFSYNVGSPSGKVSHLKQSLMTTDYPVSSGNMKISPMWPIKLPFLLMELSDDYQHCMIGYPSRAYLWIMSRSADMDPRVYEAYVKVAEEQGYDVAKIERPVHG